MSVYVGGVRGLMYHVRLISVLQLPKSPSKSTWNHSESQVEVITKQHNVQIQEAFAKVVFHRAHRLSFINTRDDRIEAIMNGSRFQKNKLFFLFTIGVKLDCNLETSSFSLLNLLDD